MAAACGNLAGSIVFVPRKVLKQAHMVSGGVEKDVVRVLAYRGWKRCHVGGDTTVESLKTRFVTFELD